MQRPLNPFPFLCNACLSLCFSLLYISACLFTCLSAVKNIYYIKKLFLMILKVDIRNLYVCMYVCMYICIPYMDHFFANVLPPRWNPEAITNHLYILQSLPKTERIARTNL